MSADLLRRAAEKLREHANAATPGPWQRTHPEWPRNTSISNGDGHRVVASVVDWPSVADSDYIALMHPPVALALAELLERISVLPQLMVLPSITEYAEGMARAILREEP